MKECSAISIRFTVAKCDRENAIIPLKWNAINVEVTIVRIKMEIIMAERPNTICAHTLRNAYD